MKNYLKIIAVTAILAAFCTPVFAGSVWNAADSAAPFAVRYKDADNTGTMQTTTNTIVLIDDGETNTITYAASYNTAAEILAGINAATNSSGTKNFEAVYWNSIAADTITNNYLVVKAATTLTKQWNYDFKWDTSTCLHYDAAVGIMVGDTPTPAGKIDRIFGDPIGTGDVTLNVYVDGSVKWSRVITSPTYTTPATWISAGTNAVTNTMVTVTSAAFDYEVNIPVGSQPAFVRAARATTATTGGIGISDTRR